jgi:hypothetical protein
MGNGIPQDEAAAISIGLEGIVYGQYHRWVRQPTLTNNGVSRLFSPHVCRHYLGINLQASTLSGRQSPNGFGGDRAVGAEHCSELLASDIRHYMLNPPKYMAVDIVRTENAFVKYRDTFPGGPSAYFEDVTQPLYVVKYLILTLQTMVGDGVLVGSIFCPHRLTHRNVLSRQRSIDVMSFGNLFGL